jgi:adenosylcobinamide-GDP ribazoletransferase
MRSFLVALAFLTIIPVRFRAMPEAAEVARSRFWYPVVGVLLGVALGSWTALLILWGRPPLVSAFLVLLAWVVLTGALHLDGFCDLCDGLLGGHTPEERLRIMKDPHLGTFALAGGVLMLLGKFALLAEVIRWPGRGPWVIGGAVAVARCLALCMAALARYPRPEGTGKVLIDAARPWEAGLFSAIGIGLTVAIAILAHLPTAWVYTLPVLAVVLSLTWLCRRRLGGVTGDCLGAAIEAGEFLFLLSAVSLPFGGLSGIPSASPL